MFPAFGEYFEFGEQRSFLDRRGKEVVRSSLRLKAVSPGCDWVVGRHGAIVVGSFDYRPSRRFFDRKTPPRDAERRSVWRAARLFLENVEDGSLRVCKVRANHVGALTIELTDGYALVVCPTSAVELDTWYFWNDNGPGVSLYASGMYVNNDHKGESGIVCRKGEA
ncbi:MAG: hypothetical protein WD716_12175 [Fimbriimonadaceae bacterium]